MFIPTSNIDVDGETPTNADNLRPESDDPFVVNSNSVTITFEFTTPARTESVRLPTNENVESFTVEYIEPGSTSPETVEEVSTTYW